MANAVMNFVNTCSASALAAVDMKVGEAVHFIDSTGVTPDWAVSAIESKISDPEWMKNYRMSALTTDVVKHATKHLGVPVSLDEQQVDALQHVDAYIRVGGCDEELNATYGYLTHAQLSDGAEFSFRVDRTDNSSALYCVKDHGGARGIALRCEQIYTTIRK